MAVKAKKAIKSIESLEPEKVTALIPVDSNETTKLDAKVTKAELTEILCIKIASSIEEELECLKKKEISLLNARTEEANNLIEIFKKSSEEIKYLNKNNLAYDTRIIYSCQSTDYYKYNSRLPTNYIELTVAVFPIKSVFLGALIISTTIKNFDIDLHSEKYTNICKELQVLEEEKSEITERLKKANNAKYVKAQLNLSVIAGMSGGEAICNNLNTLANKLSTTIFAKKDNQELTNK